MKNNSNHRTRRWLPYLGAALLMALIIAGLWPRSVPVETARVSIGPLRTTVNEEGKTRIRQRYLVSAPVAGQLQRIPFKAGAEIQRGQIVANLEKARKAHDFAASELRRSDKLSSDKTISPQELETAQWREASSTKELV